MLFKKNETMPQFADRFLRIVAFALLLMSVSYASAAIAHFAGPEYENPLETVRAIFGLGAAAIVILPFLKLMAIRAKGGKDCQKEPEGFIAEIYAKSTIMSFSVAFVGMVFMEPIVGKIFTELPPAFVIQVVLSVMMAVLGTNFFIQARADDDELDDEFEDDFDDEAGQA